MVSTQLIDPAYFDAPKPTNQNCLPAIRSIDMELFNESLARAHCRERLKYAQRQRQASQFAALRRAQRAASRAERRAERASRRAGRHRGRVKLLASGLS